MEPFPPLCTAIKAILPLMAVQLLAERWAALCSPVCHSSDAILALAPSIRRRYVARTSTLECGIISLDRQKYLRRLQKARLNVGNKKKLFS